MEDRNVEVEDIRKYKGDLSFNIILKSKDFPKSHKSNCSIFGITLNESKELKAKISEALLKIKNERRTIQ